MFNKKFAVCILLAVSAVSLASYFYLSDKKTWQGETVTKQSVAVNSQETQNKTVEKSVTPKISVKKADLYNDTEKHIPLSAISDLANIPENVRNAVDDIIENSNDGIYFLKHSNDKIVAVVDANSDEAEIKRHDFNFFEISAFDGTILNHQNIVPDSKYDKWEYKNGLPLKHIHFNENKELEFTEIWNYADNEPIKYKKTGKNNQIISLRKEIVDNDVNLREENIFYDSEGNVIQNISFNYEGLDLTRFTYYNSETPDDSAMVISEFEDGVKQKEVVYSSDYQIEKIYIPEYKDGQKSEIKVLDKDNTVLEKLIDL